MSNQNNFYGGNKDTNEERTKSIEGFYTSSYNPDGVTPTKHNTPVSITGKNRDKRENAVYKSRDLLGKKEEIDNKIIKLNTLGDELNKMVGEYEFSSDKLLKRAAEQDPNDVRLSNLFIEKKYSREELERLVAPVIRVGNFWTYSKFKSRLSHDAKVPTIVGTATVPGRENYVRVNGKPSYGNRLSVWEGTELAAQLGAKYVGFHDTVIGEDNVPRSIVMLSNNYTELSSGEKEASIFTDDGRRTRHYSGMVMDETQGKSRNNTKFSFSISLNPGIGAYIYEYQTTISSVGRPAERDIPQLGSYLYSQGVTLARYTHLHSGNRIGSDINLFYALYQAINAGGGDRYVGMIYTAPLNNNKNEIKEGIPLVDAYGVSEDTYATLMTLKQTIYNQKDGYKWWERNISRTMATRKYMGFRQRSSSAPAKWIKDTYFIETENKMTMPKEFRYAGLGPYIKVMLLYWGKSPSTRRRAKQYPDFVKYPPARPLSFPIPQKIGAVWDIEDAKVVYKHPIAHSRWFSNSCSSSDGDLDQDENGVTNCWREASTAGRRNMANILAFIGGGTPVGSVKTLLRKDVSKIWADHYIAAYFSADPNSTSDKTGTGHLVFVSIPKKLAQPGDESKTLLRSSLQPITKSYNIPTNGRQIMKNTDGSYMNFIPMNLGQADTTSWYKIREKDKRGKWSYPRPDRTGKMFYVNNQKVAQAYTRKQLDPQNENINIYATQYTAIKGVDSLLFPKEDIQDIYMSMPKCRTICNTFYNNCKAFAFNPKGLATDQSISKSGGKIKKGDKLPTCRIKDRDPSIFPFGTYTEKNSVLYKKEPQADNHWSCTNRVVYTSDSGVGGKNKEKYRLYDDEGKIADPIPVKAGWKKASQGCGEYKDYEKHLKTAKILQKLIGERLEEWNKLLNELKGYNLSLNERTKLNMPLVDTAVGKYNEIMDKIAGYRDSGDFGLDTKKVQTTQISRKSDSYVYFMWLVVCILIIILTIILMIN
jgi:hypothetical protein